MDRIDSMQMYRGKTTTDFVQIQSDLGDGKRRLRVMKVMSDKLTNNIWVGDTGASCHMRPSISGMYDLEPGSGGIKVGSGKILKAVKVDKFKGEIIQKDGSMKLIVLNKVHFVPDMYCNLFSITSAMDDGFSLTGRKDLFLALQKKDLVIKSDHVIKSGGGKLVRVKMKPTNKSPSPCIHLNASRAHDILAHAREAKTRATARKLG